MITIQRVRVRWSAAARGAPHADARRGLSLPVLLPPVRPPGDVVIHESVADEAARYERRDDVLGGGMDLAREAGLWLTPRDGDLVVERLPGLAAFPRPSGPGRLFTLAPGQVGRWRANFRMHVTTCACDPSWFFEDWLVHVCHGEAPDDGFVVREPDHDVDERVHLYGGTERRRAGGSRH